MKEFKMFWNYQKRKNGEIVIDQSEMEAMIDQAYESGYNSGLVEGMKAEKALMVSLKAGKPVGVSKTEIVEKTQELAPEMATSSAKKTDTEDAAAESVMPETETEGVPGFDDFTLPTGLEDELSMQFANIYIYKSIIDPGSLDWGFYFGKILLSEKSTVCSQVDIMKT